jgi:hypothetical protein
MTKRVGLIQTRGIGDVVIALPIADHFIEQGCEVHWPIDSKTLAAFQDAKPEVNFTPIDESLDDLAYFYQRPLEELRRKNCDPIIPLYSSLQRVPDVPDPALAGSLKFDEYKYAVAGVPFSRKWDLRLRRNLGRERALHEQLGITGPYICVHASGTDCSYDLDIPAEWRASHQIIEITPRTDNPFDWIHTLEQAAKLVMVDSCFSNLVEQLNFPTEKYLILRSAVGFTPVLKNGWKFLGRVD